MKKPSHKKTNYGYYAALIVGIAALVMLVGVYTTRQSTSEKEQYVDLNSGADSAAGQSGEQSTTGQSEEPSTASVGASVADATNSDVTDADSTDTDRIGRADLASAQTTESSTETTSESADSSTAQDKSTQSATTQQTEPTAADVSFTKKERLSWPVQGSVLLPYSMDTTVYYKTIDAYKTSSGMLIQAEKGTSVYAAYAGTVQDIYSTNDYGKMVSVDIGGGYTAIYGQLANVQVTAGQEISQGTAIATIASPTTLFSEEGTNLYFALQKDGEYVNPQSYLQ